MGKFRRKEDRADRWLRKHDPYYTDKSKNKVRDEKYAYETPEMEVVEFETEDIITASGDTPFVPAEP